MPVIHAMTNAFVRVLKVLISAFHIAFAGLFVSVYDAFLVVAIVLNAPGAHDAHIALWRWYERYIESWVRWC